MRRFVKIYLRQRCWVLREIPQRDLRPISLAAFPHEAVPVDEIPKPAKKATTAVTWNGEVPKDKWMTFYTKVLAKYAKEKGLTLKATFELRPDQGLTKQQVDDVRAALRELGLSLH